MEKLVSMKKAAAVCCAALVAAGSLSGCGSATSYAMKAGDTEIKAGVYISSIINEMNTQMNTLYYQGLLQTADDAFSQQIDGVDFADAVKENALKNTKDIAAVDAKFKELGLELTADEVSEIESTLSSAWSANGGMFEYSGVSKESYRLTLEHSYKKTAIFNYYYAEGGVEEVSDDTLQTYVNENYIRYKILSIAKSSAEDEETQNAENAEAEALINEYYEKAQDLSFEEFDTLIDEYNAYKEAKAAEESEESAESGTETDESAADAESSEADTADSAEIADTAESEGTDESAEESAAEDATVSEGELTSLEAENTESVTEEEVSADSETDESADTVSAEDTAESTEDESAADESTDEADADADNTDSAAEEEETDPYANEYIMNASDYLDTTSDSYDADYAKMVQAFKDQEYGKAALYNENEYSYVLFITEDVAGRPDYVQDNKDTLLQELKGDEFDGLIQGWVDALGIKVNEKAIKKYTVKEIYDRQTEYSKKNPAS